MTSARLRSVCDTNIVVSALVFGKRLAWLRCAWASGSVVPVVCRQTVEELIRVLAYPKFRLTPADRDTLLEQYLPFVESILLPVPPPAVPAVCRDRSDLVFIQLAIAAKADLLISGDSDLAVLSGAVSVISPVELRRRIKAEE